VVFASPVATLILASAGLALGYFGLKGPRQTAAIVALLLCCLAFAVGGLSAAADLYRIVYGVTPWQVYGPM
jgi:hypothetical protein